jgi:hypothetical protein
MPEASWYENTTANTENRIAPKLSALGDSLVAKLAGRRNAHTTPTMTTIPVISNIPGSEALAEKSAMATVNPYKPMATSCEMKKVLEIVSPARLGRSIEINLLAVLAQVFKGLLCNKALALQLLLVD